MSKKYINTLDFYGYGENNKMEPVPNKGYKVKVSDKDGNIITIEKDDSLYACVKLAFDNDTGVLSLLDVAHNDSLLAEIEMPNADYIYNCRFDDESNSILFDVKSLYGNETSTIELDVESLVELYEAGQGIEIGEKNELTGRRPISIKLAEGENILQVSESGLSISDTITTDDELAAAISGKADIEWVEEILSGFSGITEVLEILEEHEDEIEKLQRIVGTDEEIPSLFEQIEDNREDIAQIDDEIGELSGKVDTIEEKVDNILILSGDVETLKEALDEEIVRATSAETELQNLVDEEAGRAISAETELDEKIEELKTETVANVDYDSSAKTINFYNANDEIIDSIDATDFIKDGMVDSVELVEISGDTYLHIVFNTDAGKEDIYINIGDIFNADNYYTKDEIDEKVTALQEMDAALANVDTQQWSVINQNRQDMEDVDGQLWAAIETESDARTTADSGLQSQIDVEKEERETADAALNDAITAETANRIVNDAIISGSIDSKIETEKNRAILEETRLGSLISAEAENRESGDNSLLNKINEEVEEREREDLSIRQDLADDINNLSIIINGVESDLSEETAERIREDNEIKSEIGTFRELYAKKEYVDSKDVEWAVTAVTSAISLSNQYSDLKNDYLEAELKLYCDTGHTQLQNAISENATKINVISNLKGVSGSDSSNYDDTGNGILDVLHREFHQYKGETVHNATGAQIRNVDEVAIGRYNISNREIDQMTGVDVPSGCTIFSVGIGTSDSVRKNALEVRQDGSVYMWVEGDYICINNLLAMLAHETY